MAKTLIAVFVTASAGHIPRIATNTGFYFQSSSDSLHEKGKGYVILQNKLPAYMLEGLKVGINLLF